jgi:hypothetical protein
MRRTLLAVIFGLLVIGLGALGAPAASDPGFKTAKRPYLVPIDPASGVLTDPILSTGDVVGGYQMSGIPDGLGAYKDSSTLQVLMNHELGATFPGTPPGVDTRISKVTIDDKTRRVLGATYLFNGNLVTEGFERFCSSTLEVINGTPYYFTGEESIAPTTPPSGRDGSSIVMNAVTGAWTATPHFGHIQHENIVPVERIKKFMVVTTDDDFRTGQPALLLAYIADSFDDAVAGNGQLYVWRALDPTDTPFTIQEGDTIPGKFEELSQAENANSVSIKLAANGKGAFRFSRLEDAATAQQTPGRVYFADTGKVNAPGTNTDPTPTGRIYQLDIDPSDPTKASLTFLLDSLGGARFANPDNLDTSAHSLVFQEDREAPFRDIHNRVLVYDFRDKSLRAVARVDPFPGQRNGQWESSGVINAQTLLGNNWWLVDVQAHPTGVISTERQPGATAPGVQPAPWFGPPNGEDGQLLALYIPNS